MSKEGKNEFLEVPVFVSLGKRLHAGNCLPTKGLAYPSTAKGFAFIALLLALLSLFIWL